MAGLRALGCTVELALLFLVHCESDGYSCLVEVSLGPAGLQAALGPVPSSLSVCACDVVTREGPGRRGPALGVVAGSSPGRLVRAPGRLICCLCTGTGAGRASTCTIPELMSVSYHLGKPHSVFKQRELFFLVMDPRAGMPIWALDPVLLRDDP